MWNHWVLEKIYYHYPDGKIMPRGKIGVSHIGIHEFALFHHLFLLDFGNMRLMLVTMEMVNYFLIPLISYFSDKLLLKF